MILDQTLVTVRLDQVQPHPKNPRLGDVGMISSLIETNGFYGAIIVQESTGYIVVGNHRYLAAKAHGLTELPAFVIDMDDDRAMRIMIGDNRGSDVATNDTDVLIRELKELALTPEGLAGTGHDGDDLDDLIKSNSGPMFGDDKEFECPQCGFKWQYGPDGIEPV